MEPADKWTKSSYSTTNNCVSVATLENGDIAVRDDKDQNGPILRFTPEEWTAFTAGVGNGEFDVAALTQTV